MEVIIMDESFFLCLNDGCVKIYQWYFVFEKYFFFGKCELVFERELFLDKVKRLYCLKLLEGVSV